MANEIETKSYDDSQIQVLEGLEAVRKRPGMYIGTTSLRGLHHLVYEIVDNSIDEALAGECDYIKVTIWPDNSVSVEDDGRGIPSGMNEKLGIPTLEVVYTVLHAGGKFGGDGYKIAGGLHGVGASVVNALSEWVEVENCRDGNRYTERFEKGAVARPFKCEGDSNGRHGLYVRFKPDATIFEDTVFDYEILLTRMREQAFLNAGVKIILADTREGLEREEVLHYEGGIISFVEYLNNEKRGTPVHNDVIYMKGEKDGSIAEVAMQYNDSYNETIISFANNMSTIEGGTHETGFKSALTRAINNYCRKAGIIKGDDKGLSGEDVREGLVAIISVKLTDAQFESQTKAKLGNSEIRTLVESIVTTKLEEYLEENPQEAKLIIEKALDKKVDFIIATPPCQGMSKLGSMSPNDVRNQLVYYAVDVIKKVKPKFILLENVPQALITKIDVDGKTMLIPDYLRQELGEFYNINEDQRVKAMDHGVPQMRPRCIFLFARKDTKITWDFPVAQDKPVTLKEALKDIPSLDPMLREGYEETIEMFPDFEKKKAKGQKLSKWHYPPIHSKRHVE